VIIATMGVVAVGLALLLVARGCSSEPSASDGVSGSGAVTVGPGVVTLSGTAAGVLGPGTSSPINIGFDNPNGAPVTIDHLIISIRTVVAPNATADLPCTAADYYLQQSPETVKVLIAAGGKASLSSLGVSTASWPRVGMLNSPANQDGCKGALINLRFTATGQQ
jgi:hypothetical protein